jgi:hypothetical protein
LAPDVLSVRRPDYLVVLPWNIVDEVRERNAALLACGTRIVTAVPQLAIS